MRVHPVQDPFILFAELPGKADVLHVDDPGPAPARLCRAAEFIHLEGHGLVRLHGGAVDPSVIRTHPRRDVHRHDDGVRRGLVDLFNDFLRRAAHFPVDAGS